MSDLSEIKEAVADYWGERCPEQDADCVCCKVWREIDSLDAITAYVHKKHNGYNESARAAMDIAEPPDMLTAIRELVEERVDMANDDLRAENARLRERVGEAERLKEWMDTPITEGVVPEVKVCKPPGRDYWTYEIPGANAGPFKTWIEAYLQGCWHLEMNRGDAQQQRADAAEAKLSEVQAKYIAAEQAATVAVQAQTIIKLAGERDAAESKLAAAEKRYEAITRLNSNRGIYLSEYFDSVEAAGIDVGFQDGDEVTGAPAKLLEWVKAAKSKLAAVRAALEKQIKHPSLSGFNEVYELVKEQK